MDLSALEGGRPVTLSSTRLSQRLMVHKHASAVASFLHTRSQKADMALRVFSKSALAVLMNSGSIVSGTRGMQAHIHHAVVPEGKRLGPLLRMTCLYKADERAVAFLLCLIIG